MILDDGKNEKKNGKYKVVKKKQVNFMFMKNHKKLWGQRKAIFTVLKLIISA